MGDGKKIQVTPAVVDHIADLANIPVSASEKEDLAFAFTETLKEVENIFAVDVTAVKPTHHVTGSVNVWREDAIDKNQILPQEVAISQAIGKLRGYIVVDRILEEEYAG